MVETQTIDLQTLNRQTLENCLYDKDKFLLLSQKLQSPEFKKAFVEKVWLKSMLENQFPSKNFMWKLWKALNSMNSIISKWWIINNSNIFSVFQDSLWTEFSQIDSLPKIRVVELYINTILDNSSPVDLQAVLNSSKDTFIAKDDILQNLKLADFAYLDVKHDNRDNTWKLQQDNSIWKDIDINKFLDANWKLLADFTWENYHTRLFCETVKKDLDKHWDNIAQVLQEKWIDESIIHDPVFSQKERETFQTQLANIRSKNMLASNDNFIYIDPIRNDYRLIFIFYMLKIFKELQNASLTPEQMENKQTRLKNVKKDYDILWKFKNNSDGFSATIVQDKNTWTKTLAVRWSDDTYDFVFSDVDIWLWFTPEQKISLWKCIKEFKQKWLISKWEKINIVWHSLWGTLSEITDIDYQDIVNKSYNFNWPWAWNLFTKLPETAWQNTFKVRNMDIIWNYGVNTANYIVPVEWENPPMTNPIKYHYISELEKWIESMNEILIIDRNRFKWWR